MKTFLHLLILSLSLGLTSATLSGAEPPLVDIAAATEATADTPPLPTAADALFTAHNLWMMIAAALVFIMHLGFASLESGLTRAKNTTNILFKNMMVVCIGILTYAFCGFNLMYPGVEGGWFAWAGLGITPPENGMTAEYAAGYTYWTDFLFQAMFAATAATIVSGAVAERIKLSSFLIFATIFVAVLLPHHRFWKWGTGWLHVRGFYDFAGSTLVHSVGGWGALAGVILLGPVMANTSEGKSARSSVIACLWLPSASSSSGSAGSASTAAPSSPPIQPWSH
jgi:ammonium transporter, Amt family